MLQWDTSVSQKPKLNHDVRNKYSCCLSVWKTANRTGLHCTSICPVWRFRVSQGKSYVFPDFHTIKKLNVDKKQKETFISKTR